VNKKAQLLQVAAKHFSKHGYEGVSLDAIAKEASITKAAIYYHFKDKDALYEAVLLLRLENLVAHIKASLTATEPEEKLRQYIESFGAFLEDYPCFAAILAHEFADEGAHMSEKAVQTLSQTLGTLTAILNEGIAQGVFTIQNPFAVQLMIVSSLVLHQTTAGLRKRVAAYVQDYAVTPEPDIKDLAKMLATKIIQAIRKER